MDATAIDGVLRTARSAVRQAPPIGDDAYPRFALRLGAAIDRDWPIVEEANERDVAAGRDRGLAEPSLRRIRLTGSHRRQLASLAADMPGELLRAVRPGQEYGGRNGTRAWRVPKPLGVLLMIYEARPTVTIDGALLPVCAGNAVLLRGGTEIGATNAALAEVIAGALAEAGLPAGMVQVLSDLDRAGIRALLRRDDAIDVLVPRGSPSLVDFCRSTSRIPMIVAGGGVNHQYVRADADVELAVRLVLDAKVAQPEGCTALEAVLLDPAVVADFCRVLAKYAEEPDVRGLALHVSDDLVSAFSAGLRTAGSAIAVRPLTPADLGREFLGPTLAVTSASTMDDAVTHINRYGSGHTEGIVTRDGQAADEFCQRVDAAALIVNGSLRLHDGPLLGLGPELVIGTGRLHARGPVRIADLMTHSWRVDGNGTVRFRVP